MDQNELSMLDWLQSIKPKPKKRLDFLRPQSFDEYVGQSRAKTLAKITVEAALKEGRPLPNTLISGPFGQGKTALAQIMSIEYGKNIPLVDASSINKEMVRTGTLIIDEIHNLDPQTCDSYNILIDSGTVHIVGATTNPGALPAAFRSRFRQINLEPYTIKDINEILQKVLTRREIDVSAKITEQIAKRARFNPRIALNYLSFALDFASVKGITLQAKTIDQAFHELGVDAYGFSLRDYAYMGAIPADRSVGLQFISAVSNIDQKTIEEEVEPYLMQMGLVDRSTKGRRKIKEISSVF